MRALLRDGLADYEDGHDDLAGRPHLATQRPPALGLRLAAGAGAGGGRAARRRRLRAPALLARLPPPGAGRDPVPPPPRLPAAAAIAGRARSGRWRPGTKAAPATRWSTRRCGSWPAEGFMHNRARMTVASFLCKDLYVDWRAGAWHFWDLLSDGEIANNAGNWQWVAGTGNDTRPNRVLNPRPPGAALRPRRPLRAPLPAGAGGGAGQGDLRTLADGRLRAARLPAADRRPRRGGGRVQGPPGRIGSGDGTAGRHPRQQRARAGRRGDRRCGGRAGGGDRPAPQQRRGLRPSPRDRPRRDLRPLAEQGCDRVLAIGSVGSLRPGELAVGALLCPDDFIALNLGDSIFERRPRPLGAGLRPALARAK